MIHEGGIYMEPLIFSQVKETMYRLNRAAHADYSKLNYHMSHLEYVYKYTIKISRKLGIPVDTNKWAYISYGHDLLKEHGLDPNKHVTWKGIEIPQDPNRYVRMNLDVLEEYKVEEYFNSDMQYHALASAIFMVKEMHIISPEIIYPIMFHSCPIMDIYNTLPKHLQTSIDITMLADKLSSNWLRINLLDKEVCCDLDLAVFGESGREFNYTLGLYLARLISQGKSDGGQSKITTEYYYDRLCMTNPLIKKKPELGGKQQWPKRNQPLQTQ